MQQTERIVDMVKSAAKYMPGKVRVYGWDEDAITLEWDRGTIDHPRLIQLFSMAPGPRRDVVVKSVFLGWATMVTKGPTFEVVEVDEDTPQFTSVSFVASGVDWNRIAVLDEASLQVGEGHE